MSTEWEIITNSVIVKPKGDPIFSELATYISVEDEAAGPYVVLKQDREENIPNEIRIDIEEWTYIRRATDMLIDVCKSLNEVEKGHEVYDKK